jgi:ammonia channel protein AmtB
MNAWGIGYSVWVIMFFSSGLKYYLCISDFQTIISSFEFSSLELRDSYSKCISHVELKYSKLNSRFYTLNFPIIANILLITAQAFKSPKPKTCKWWFIYTLIFLQSYHCIVHTVWSITQWAKQTQSTSLWSSSYHLSQITWTADTCLFYFKKVSWNSTLSVLYTLF